MPDSYNLVVNTAHPLVEKLLADEETQCAEKAKPFVSQVAELQSQLDEIDERNKSKKYDEISPEDKTAKDELRAKIDGVNSSKKAIYSEYAATNPIVGQLIDLALLANGMLKGEELAKFVKRSVAILK
jgi:molecular chaperone HtpG